MPIEAVVCHYPSEVWVANEEDPEEVVNLTLIPIRAVVKTCDAWDGRSFVCVCLDSDARVVSDAEKVIDNLEAGIPRRIIDCRNVRHHGELRSCVVFEEGHDRDNSRRRDVDGELVLPDRELLDVFGEA